MNNTHEKKTSDRVITGAVILVAIMFFVTLNYWFFYQNILAQRGIRFFVVLIFTILPASMYYVFISSRKSILFQDYVNNLYRLGLLQFGHNQTLPQDTQGVSMSYMNRMRIQSYVLRFEGIYGPVDKNYVDSFMKATKSSNSLSEDPVVEIDVDDTSTESMITFATIIPVLMSTILVGVCWIAVLPPWVDPLGSFDSLSPSYLKNTFTINAYAPQLAFLGAYFYSIQMLFSRFMNNDLRPKIYVSISMRIALAVIGAWALTSFAGAFGSVFDSDEGKASLLLLSFIVGAFPAVLWRLIREAGSRIPGIKTAVPSMDSRLPASELDGLTVWHQTRLEEEDVENTYNMANADIVDLLLQTKIPANRIIDWVDQAILYTMLSDEDSIRYKERKQKLSAMGIRSASMLELAMSDTDSSNRSGLESALKSSTDDGQENAITVLKSIDGFANYQYVKNWKSHQM